ncbi:BFH_collapsed_G0021040.mRNA.1.CDS.1 [Saccharomyces cerevisiae]|nr:BFH_collapsed_G0021040.mRNA.1.CDS.1 [Saccharomyces cerevisiae]
MIIQSRTLAKFLMEISIAEEINTDGNYNPMHTARYTKAKLYPVCQLLNDYLVMNFLRNLIDEFLKNINRKKLKRLP